MSTGQEVRKRGISYESLPLYATTNDDDIPTKDEEAPDDEAVHSVPHESLKRNFYWNFISAVAILTLVALLSMQLLNLEQQKFQRMEKTISELKAQVRAAQNELAVVRKAKAWEESDAMTSFLHRLDKAERNTQQYKKDTEQRRKDLEQCKRDAGEHRNAEHSSSDATQCQMEMRHLMQELDQCRKDSHHNVSERVRCAQELGQLKSASLKPN